MTKSRLWKYPEETINTLKAILSGNSTKSELADTLEISESSVNNILHDPRHLNLVERSEGQYEVSDEVREIIQLENYEILEEKFTDLPGVEKIKEELDEKGSLDAERIGRLVSFETESGASATKTFQNYGLVYATWFDWLDLGYKLKDTLYDEPEEGLKQKSSRVKVSPEKVSEALKIIEDCEDREELSERLGYSESFIDKITSSLYVLGLATYDRRKGFQLTDRGKSVNSESLKNKKEILKEALLEVSITKAYLEHAPDSEHDPKEVISEISEDYMLGWSEVTIETTMKKLRLWMDYTGLYERVDSSLKPTEKAQDVVVSSPTSL